MVVFQTRDIDSDFDADRREEVKAYLERRYNKNGLLRVFSAGTFTTEKIKSVIKDVARTHKVPIGTTNYLTAILDDKMSWTDLMKVAATDKRIHDFIEKYPDVFEEILPIMGQSRAAGIHASALIITPEYVKGECVNCYDLLPIRKMGDLLVSEVSGTEIDAIGILKNDLLGIRELTRLSDMFRMIKQEYGKDYTILEIASRYLNDPKVFDIIKSGNTQGLFQLNGEGMTKFIKRMKPDDINDMIALVALFRPGPLDSGAADNYVRAKNKEYEPQYLWGTYEILKDTYGEMIYQEEISQVAQKVGGLTLGDGVNLVKALSKKKLEKVRKFKDKFFEGAKKNGCPKEAADKIWSDVEDAAKYSFNKSHATAYGLTAYVGAWLKVYYPTAFYTVVLRDQDTNKLPVLMNEIRMVGGTKLEQPDINISGKDFTADFKNNKIYWSLSRIKQLGPRAVDYILQERNLYGEFDGLEDFIKRIFRSRFSDDTQPKYKNFNDDGTEATRVRNPVTARCVKSLIMSGAFDNSENVLAVIERFGLMQKAATLLDFEVTEKDVPKDMADKHYFWSQQQINIAGIGAVDYQRIYDNIKDKPSSAQKFIEFNILLNPYNRVEKGVICATIVSVVEKSYKDKQTGQRKSFGKIELMQNTDTNTLVIFGKAWEELRGEIKNASGHILAAMVNVKWSDYEDKFNLQYGRGCSWIKII